MAKQTLIIIAFIATSFSSNLLGQGFPSNSIQWNIPDLGHNNNQVSGSMGLHSVLDFDGDGKVDLIDASDGSGSPFMSGTQRYWKVYLNTGNGFSANSIQWNVPDLGHNNNQVSGSMGLHSVLDFDGDGKVDLIDASDGSGSPFMSGTQRYWKVYLNTGNGFSANSIQWNVPDLGGNNNQVYGNQSRHSALDFDGDGKVDLIDANDQSINNVYLSGTQRYWKVYLNTGNGFSANSIQWNVPDLGGNNDQVFGNLGRHSVLDFDGDGKVDLIDANDQSINNVYLSGTQRYWKVYLNTGNGFSANSIQWNVPDLGGNNDQIFGNLGRHSVLDFDGDGKVDLIDANDQSINNVYLSGTQRYWKVYLNTGNGFGATSIQWNIPDLGLYNDQVYGNSSLHSVQDFDGDGKVDLIDASDGSGSPFMSGTQRYWKVYANLSTVDIKNYSVDYNSITVYPNPCSSILKVKFNKETIESSYSITNSIGSIIIKGNITTLKNEIDLSDLPDGLYYLRLNSITKIIVKN